MDISELAETYDIEIRTAVRANIGAEEAILKELSRKQYNRWWLRRPAPG